MTVQARELVKGIAKLASLPEVCVRVNEMVDDPRSSAADIGRVISRDTALTAQLLRMANSAFYNFPSKVDTISRAVTVVGERELRYLVLALSAVRTFSQIPVEMINMASFWRHSVYCGVVARLVASHCHVLHSERLFVAGLLHDLGKLVMMNRAPEQEKIALTQSDAGEKELHIAEQELFGFDHAEVGSILLRQWNIPAALCETVACHHDISKAEEARLDAAVVHIANVVANRAELPDDYAGPLPEVDPMAWEITGLSEDKMAEITDEAAPMFAESWAMIQPIVRHA
jgi:putative nucleotidyltransferase with HDIG domain